MTAAVGDSVRASEAAEAATAGEPGGGKPTLAGEGELPLGLRSEAEATGGAASMSEVPGGDKGDVAADALPA